MSQIDQVIKDIKNKKLHPIYFLSGDEPFYIDLISRTIETEVLNEDEKAFNQTIIYGNEVEIDDIVALAKQFPMGAERQVLIVKEAQHLSKKIDSLEMYAETPQKTTILVLNYKGKTIDKRKKLYKNIQKTGLVLEFKKLYEDQIPNWIGETSKNLRLNLDLKSRFLLAEYLGNDISRIYNELQKLKLIAPNGEVTPEIIEKNIGISKDYNNFELRKAIENRDVLKSMKIAKYFGQNPKENPLLVSLYILHQSFVNIISYHILQDKSKSNVVKELKIHPYFVNDLAIAARNYPLKKATRIISLLREADAKNKGIGPGGNAKDDEILKELIVKIFRV